MVIVGLHHSILSLICRTDTHTSKLSIATMKSFFVLASLVACVFAQRLHINTPTNGQGVPANTVFTVELKQDVRYTSFISRCIPDADLTHVFRRLWVPLIPAR